MSLDGIKVLMAKFNQQSSLKLAWLFILPQLTITVVFFIWPAAKACLQSFFYADAFGLVKHFAGFANFIDLFSDESYLQALKVTLILAFSITLLTMVTGLIIALLVSQRKKVNFFINRC